MFEEYIQYSPGNHKLWHHHEHLAKIEKGEIVGPIHISVFPTNRCQLKCKYCCFQNEERNNIELSLDDYCKAIDVLKKYGLKAQEYSGGGDPLLWTCFNEAVDYAYNAGIKLSLVSNGLALAEIPQITLSKFAWIRISVQSAKYARKIAFDHIPEGIKKSMSFIVPDQKSLDELEKLYQFAKETNTIVRVAPMRPCTPEWAIKVEEETKRFGFPFLFFHKEAGAPKGCYFAYIRAAIDWRGNFMPCPSIEQAYEYFGKLPEDFALCHVSKLEDWLINNPPHDLGYRCSYCNCGKQENDFIYNLLQPMEDQDFV